MQRVLKSKWKENWVMTCLVLLFAGLMLSRALVSFASVMIVVPFLFERKLTAPQKKDLIAVGLILLPVLISGLWSDDKTLWWNSLSVKIPLLTLLLGLYAVTITDDQWKKISITYIIIISLGSAWSIGQYLLDATAMEAAYLKAKVLPTPADADYVRFSWMVVIAILLGIKCFLAETQKRIQLLLILLIFCLVIYLHMLAAKTGLLCLYGAIGIYILHVFLMEKKWKRGLLLIVIFSSFAFIAYNSLPTLRNRVQYVLYDFSLYAKGNTAPGYNDAARWLSIRAGYNITKEHPVTGVGFGDLLPSVEQWHQINNPGGFDYERFRPACEWLVYSAGSGILGMLCFSAGIFFLLFRNTGRNPLSIILAITTLVPLLTDDTLEGQFGVILLAFIVFFGQQKLTNRQDPS